MPPMIIRQKPIHRVSYSAGGGGGGGSYFSFPLPAGNAIPAANFALKIISPRPDSETASYERHRLIPSTIPFFFPCGAIGGIPPYRWSISTDMSGLTIGADLPRDWQTNGPGGYGCLQCVNPAIASSTTTITCTDQAGNTDSVVITTNGVDLNDTTKFLWYAPTNGNNSNSGSYASPYKDDWTKANGTASSSTTIQGQVWFKEAGTITPVKHTDLTNSIRLDNTKRPVVFCCNRDSSFNKVAGVISYVNTRFNSINGGNASGGFTEMDEKDSNSALFTDFQNWLIDDSQNRFTKFQVGNTNIGLGSSGTDNASGTFFTTGATSTDSTYNHYVFFRECVETDRPSASNSYGMVAAFGLKYSLFEFCKTIRSLAEADIYLKDSCDTVTVRYCNLDNDNSGAYGVGAVGGQNQNGGSTTNIEYLYCFFNGLNIDGRGVRFNASSTSSGVGNGFTARCTFRGSWSALSTGGTYKSTNDVVYTSNSPSVDAGSNSLTNAGTELQGNTAWFNSSGNLTATYAAYLGTRGWEISDS